jgi:hypothetical protein
MQVEVVEEVISLQEDQEDLVVVEQVMLFHLVLERQQQEQLILEVEEALQDIQILLLEHLAVQESLLSEPQDQRI